MLIHLDNSLCEELGRDAESEAAAIEFFEHLSRMRRTGQHFVTGPRKLLGILKDHRDLSKAARGVFHHLYNNTEQKALQSAFIRRLEVTANTLEATIRAEANCRILRLPLRQVALLEGKTILLCENPLDCEFLTIVGYVYLTSHQLRGVTLASDTWGGGGSTISGQYASIQSVQNRFCLCIVDSDQRWPNGPLGRTAQDVQKVDAPDKHLTELMLLPVRELENLLTPQMIESVVSVLPTPLLNLYSSHPQAYNYLDLKKGLYGYDILSLPDNHEGRAYWHPILVDIGCNALHPTPSCVVDDTPMCINHAKGSKVKCTCVLIQGLGDKLIALILKGLFKRCSPSEISKMIDAARKSVWNEIGALVVAWCCAPKQRST